MISVLFCRLGIFAIFSTHSCIFRFFRCNYASLQEVVSVRRFVRRSVPCYFRKTNMVIYEGKKSSNDIINNDTMSDDQVVASYVPPRNLFSPCLGLNCSAYARKGRYICSFHHFLEYSSLCTFFSLLRSCSPRLGTCSHCFLAFLLNPLL